MPSFLKGATTESVKLASSDSSPYSPPHRKSQERSSLVNAFAADGSTGTKGIIDGLFMSDANGLNPSLHSLPNGRSSGSLDSREWGRFNNDSTLTMANGIGTYRENERQAPGLINGVAKYSSSEQVHAPALENGDVLQHRTSESHQSSDTVPRTGHARTHSSSAPQRHGTHNTYSSQADTPSASIETSYIAPSSNRFSSPANFASSTATPPASSTSSLHPGPVRLQHRHTLQVPRISTTSTSRDTTTSRDTNNFPSDAIGEGERSPTNFGIGRVSTNLGRRRTRSVSDQVDDIAPDDGMSRWTETVKQKRASRRHRKEEEEDDRVIVGTKVDMNHVNWVTAYNMLTGIRFTVSRTNAKIDRELTDADFDAKHKFSFDITGNELTPSAKYDFKFKDYAPWVFRRLRAKFMLDPADYLMSLTSKYILSELGSPGKSGSFFYFSRDYKYIIKTIHHAEHKLLRRILRDYYAHIENYPNTLISQFYGLHRVKIPYGRKIHFVIMNNLFPPHRDIHQTFDLKGSTIGRDFKEGDLEHNPRATLKDLNWLRRNYHFEFGSTKKEIFIEQMKHDVALLQRLKIMDYSLLVGIHDMSKGNEENLRDKTLQVFQPGGDRTTEPQPNLLLRTPSKLENQRKAKELRELIRREKPVPMEKSTNMLPDEILEERKSFIFHSDDGGFRATHENGEPGEEIYYLGIIDCLTHYGFIKRAEHLWKGLSHNKSQISPIPPEGYGDRFVKFITGLTMTKEEVEREIRNSEQGDGSISASRQVTRTSTDRVISKAEHQADKTRRDGSSEDPNNDRILTTMRSPSTDRSNGVTGATLPVVEEDGEAASREDSMRSEKVGGSHLRAKAPLVTGDRPPPTPPKEYPPNNKELPSIPHMPRLSMTEALQAGQRPGG